MAEVLTDDEPTTINGLTLRPSVRKRWAEALRSGEYKQGTLQLKSSEGYCCLGVLCEISGLNYSGSFASPPLGVQTWAGLVPDGVEPMPLKISQMKAGGRPLYQLNDDDYLTFDQIADIIEGK